MLILRGAPALSDFRLSKLQAKLQQISTEIGRVRSEFVHFADLGAGLSDEETRILGGLLEYGPSAPLEDFPGVLFLTVPRTGTISPWSSKATDIVHNCGLDSVLRVERGIAYCVEMPTGSSGQLSETVASCLYDRMVEQVLPELELAQQLFSHASPGEMTSVDILGVGDRRWWSQTPNWGWHWRKMKSIIW